VSDAADRHIAELEAEVERLQHVVEIQGESMKRGYGKVKDLEKKLVERDIYEAQQILPPEQAALIKHLATVERCIDEGPQEFVGYDLDVRCTFCREGEEVAHQKDCAWLALQFDRKPEATMTMVHKHALSKHESWKRWQKAKDNPRVHARSLHEPRPAMEGHFHTMTGEALRQANEVIERSRAATIGNVRVYENPLVAPGRVYLMQNAVFAQPSAQAPDYADLERRAFDRLSPEERRQLVHGEWALGLGDPIDESATSEHPEPTAVDPARFFAGTNMTDALRYAMAHGSQLVSMTHDDITVDVPVSEVAAPDDDKVP
jgi:hypothetical protein